MIFRNQIVFCNVFCYVLWSFLLWVKVIIWYLNSRNEIHFSVDFCNQKEWTQLENKHDQKVWWHVIVHDGTPWSPSWHTSQTMMAYLANNDGIPCRQWWHTSKTMMTYLKVHIGMTWCPWWHTSKSMMTYLKVHDDIPRSPHRHDLMSMMAYLEVHDGIPQSPWWHTLKPMMAYLEDHDGISWRPWWQKEKRVEFLKKLDYELISQNTSWKELIKERVVFPKYATRQSRTIGQGQYWRKKNLKMRWTDGAT